MVSLRRVRDGLTRLGGIALIASAALALGSCGGASAPPEPTAMGDADNWPVWGRTDGEQHYSPLDQIDTKSVDRLKLAWHVDLDPENTLTEPVAADGKLFVTTGHSHIRAFDATNGELLWDWDSKTREQSGIELRMGWGPKGIAYWNNRVFVATQDGRIVALDAESGNPIWTKRDFPEGEMRYINGPPRIFDGKLIIGHGGADVSAIRGYASAYDAMTGERVWRFYTVPGSPEENKGDPAQEMAAKTWNGEWWKLGGGGTAWNAFTYDPETDLIYIGVGNGFPYNQALRSPGGGDNLFLASIVAVKADTGEYVWHYQVCPGEQWDCTATQDMTLATLEIDGEERKVIMQAPKNGFFYVLDRATGEYISAEKIAKVTWAERIDENGRPVENPGIRYHGKPGMFELWPGLRGAHSWLPQSYSPRTGLVYIPVIEGGSLIGDENVPMTTPTGLGDFKVNAVPDPDLEDGRASYLKAWDPVTQTEAWRVKLPGNWPGGTMATAGDLVFQGRIDGQFVAYDAKTGEQLWSFATQSPVVAPPITYRVNGKQYVTVITGSGASGGGILSTGLANYRTDYRMPRRILTFALDGEDSVPDFEPAPLEPVADPDYAPDPDLAAQGAVAYGMKGCIACHGWNAVGGGSAPDLRQSPYITDADAFAAVVQEGALLSSGMPGFPELTDGEVAAIRQFLRARAQQMPAELAAAREAAKEEARRGNGSFAGSWDLSIDSPVGEQKAVANLSVDGNRITGTVAASQGSLDVSGTVENGRAKFSGKSNVPFPMTIEYDLVVDGDSLSGKSKSGPFGTFPVSGTRKEEE
ncbi:PQQ-dependent dehydrogenase, methanol/ethanol family [Stakelama tenebrarum]|uniref:PQQ-dependent dehydrogenase, methanol/ethanol family n=1 Tax=Stakelama tenebrarum TaxID=2711215 RepID=A0A6G6Y4X3_9SPHN|nr:PQQ-dependent dehydrogenase, methanol/ethanol family [Sphingosinithalassobacter tenebrarum]QIG79653.1 PQQ-dependent dehydrogenase, methanol/ethanol family [Sphingosinithalassobacter tenebrarum]